MKLNINSIAEIAKQKQQDNFVTRTHELLQNYEICPFVFRVFEALKKELNWVDI